MAANEEIVVQLRAEIGQLKSKLQEATDSIGKFGQDSSNSFKQPINPIKELGSSIKSLVIGYIGLQAATQLVGKAFDQSIKLDSVKSAFTAILGSAELADAQLQQISDTADYLGLNFLDLATAYKSFAAAALSSNQTLGDTNKIFDSVTKAAAVLKLSSEDVKGTLNALGQMFSKGTVSAEELRGQLGERLPGAVALMAAGLGVTTKELSKMLDQGQITTAAVVKLADQLNIAYGDKITGKVETLQASVQRLNNTFTQSVDNGNIGKFFQLIVDGANRALNGLELLIQGLKNPGKSAYLIELENGMQSYLDIVKKVNSTPINPKADQKDLILQQGLVNAAIEQNVHLLVLSEKVYGKSSAVTKNLDNGLTGLYKRLKSINDLIKDPNTTPPIDPNTIKGLTDKIKQLKTEQETLTGVQLISKQTEINKATQELDKLILKAKGITKGDIGYIEFQIKIKQDSLKGMTPGSGLFKQTEKEIQALQDTIDAIDPTSITWVTREIGRLEDEAAKLPQGSKEIQNLKDKIIELTSTKQAFDDFFKVPPVGAYNILEQKLSDLHDAQKKATDKAGWDALQKQIQAVELEMQNLTATIYTNAEAFKTIWQDAFGSFIQGTQGAFEQALWSGKNFTQNFKEAFLQMIKAMIAKLAAALIMALLLSVVLGGLGLGSIGAGAKILGMTGVTNFGTLLGSTLGSNMGGKVAMPSGSVSNSGQVAFEIQGDKLVGVLQNYNGRLNRLV